MRTFDFDACHACVMELEGGYADLAADHGGSTKYGITEATLAAYGSQHGVTVPAIQDLTPELARDIYHANYWAPGGCEELPNALRLMHYHFAVNCGVGTANKLLQRVAGAVEDGVVGPGTLRAVDCQDVDALISQLAARQLKHYADIWEADPPQAVFSIGWLHRVCRVLQLIYED